MSASRDADHYFIRIWSRSANWEEGFQLRIALHANEVKSAKSVVLVYVIAVFSSHDFFKSQSCHSDCATQFPRCAELLARVIRGERWRKGYGGGLGRHSEI
jgi:hypothetical protein